MRGSLTAGRYLVDRLLQPRTVPAIPIATGIVGKTPKLQDIYHAQTANQPQRFRD